MKPVAMKINPLADCKCLQRISQCQRRCGVPGSMGDLTYGDMLGSHLMYGEIARMLTITVTSAGL